MAKGILLLMLLIKPFIGLAQDMVPYDTLFIRCLDPFKMEKHYLINDNTSYQGLLQYKARHTMCSDLTLPEIDFTTKTLIGCMTSSEGCRPPGFTRTIEAVADNYKVKIKIKTNGACRRGFFYMHWFVVDKIDRSKKIDFEIKY